MLKWSSSYSLYKNLYNLVKSCHIPSVIIFLTIFVIFGVFNSFEIHWKQIFLLLQEPYYFKIKHDRLMFLLLQSWNEKRISPTFGISVVWLAHKDHVISTFASSVYTALIVDIRQVLLEDDITRSDAKNISEISSYFFLHQTQHVILLNKQFGIFSPSLNWTSFKLKWK